MLECILLFLWLLARQLGVARATPPTWYAYSPWDEVRLKSSSSQKYHPCPTAALCSGGRVQEWDKEEEEETGDAAAAAEERWLAHSGKAKV